MLSKNLLLIFLLSLFSDNFYAQTPDTVSVPLQEVVVTAWESRAKLKDVPAPVSYINSSTLERFSAGSIVQAINTTPGIRMEERSPGSYKINIRGSSLRSPFGVRNVKVYFNNIPITDPGGHTYLNQLGYYNFRSIEIIRGPGSSLYGSGTGGVLLIESSDNSASPGALAEYTTGSHSIHNAYGSITAGSKNFVSRAGFQHQQSDGYRDHSALKRNVLSWSGLFQPGKNTSLKTTFLYGNLFYETPGALTRAEFDAAPAMARPGNASFPGAEKARASVGQHQFIAGTTLSHQLISHLVNTTTLYGMFTELRNPTIQNYGRSSEPHFGGRTAFKWKPSLPQSILNVDFGAELQQGFASVNIHKNAGGFADSLRTSDEINNRQVLVFAQASVESKGWMITGSTSVNFLNVKFNRFTPASAGRQVRSFNYQVAPRVTIMKKFQWINVYAGISKGFSPPTTSELLPTGGAINLDLDAEEGWNYDAGLKGTTAGSRLYFDINAYFFSLHNTIVQRRTSAGGDYYINAGKTSQHGVETFVSYSLPRSLAGISKSTAWLSHTLNNFHYKDFKQLSNDFSGNRLPGVAQHVLAAGCDVATKKGWLGMVSYYFSGGIPLNDAGSAYAESYHLLSLKAGYEKWLQKKYRIKLSAGTDNLLGQKYSLGNDINGFGGRYYNAAAGRTFYIAVTFTVESKLPGNSLNF